MSLEVLESFPIWDWMPEVLFVSHFIGAAGKSALIGFMISQDPRSEFCFWITVENKCDISINFFMHPLAKFKCSERASYHGNSMKLEGREISFLSVPWLYRRITVVSLAMT